MKRLLLLVCVVIFCSGCASASRQHDLQSRVTLLEELLEKSNQEKQALQKQLQENELKIKELRKKLESVGIF